LASRLKETQYGQANSLFCRNRDSIGAGTGHTESSYEILGASLKQHLLDKESDTFTFAGIEDVKVRAKRPSTNGRAGLNVRRRAFATKA